MRNRKDDESDIIKSIKESFQDPFSSVNPITINSEIEAENETSQISTILNQNDWNQKSLAIQRSLSLLKGGANRFQSFNLIEIVSSVSLSILDVRSTLVKNGTLLITAAAKVMGDNFANCADFVIPNLFKQTNSGKLFISGSCKYTILSIVENTQKPRVMKTILAESISKSAAKRLITVESIVTALQEWPRSIALSIPDLQKVILSFVSDPSQEVREFARYALSLYEGTPFSHMQGQTYNISPMMNLRRSLKPMQIPDSHLGSVKNTKRKMATFSSSKMLKGKSLFVLPSIDQTSMFEINQVMPPEDEAAADQFCKLLVSIVKSESYFALEGLEFALPSSIIIASKMSSAFNTVVVMIPQLFSAMPGEFKDHVAEIIITTKVNKRLIKRAFELFGENNVIHNFIEISPRYPKETMQFFAEVIKNNYMVKFDEETELFLQQIVKTGEKSAEANVVSKYFSADNIKHEENLEKMFGNLKSFIIGDKFSQNELNIRNVDDFIIYLESSSNIFIDLLTDSKDVKKNIVLTFLLESLEICGKGSVQLTSIFPCLFDLLIDPKHHFSGKAHDILELLFCDVEDLFPYLKSHEYYSAAVSFLAKQIQQNKLDSSILKCFNELSNLILNFLVDSNVSTRRQCILILSKISSIVGLNFQSIFVEMTPVQQKLVNFYQEKMISNSQKVQ